MNKFVTKLRTRMVVSHITIALIAVGLISLLSNLFLEQQFQDYVTRKIDNRHLEIVDQIEKLYQSEDEWNVALIETIGISALGEGLILRVQNLRGDEIFSARAMDHMMCDLMLNQISENMRSRYPQWQGEYVEIPYPLTVDGKKVGSVEIGFFGPYYYLESDLEFLHTLNRILLAAGIISFLTAAGVAILMSKRLTRPILRVTAATQRIAEGHYDERIGSVETRTHTLEIDTMTKSVDHLAQTLEQQAILRKRLTSDVAHELRTPLSTVQIHLEGMLDGIFKADEYRLSLCHEEIKRLQRLVGDLEQLSRVEHDMNLLHKKPFDLAELVLQQADLHKNQATLKSIDLKVKCAKNEDQPMVLSGDRDKISQVLVNILANSIKFTPEGGSIEIVCVREGATALIQVTDTGVGIAEKDLPFVFERFYRVDPSRSRGTGGAGIGLTISKTIIEAHGGKIEIGSKGLGSGTQIVIRLPIESSNLHI